MTSLCYGGTDPSKLITIDDTNYARWCGNGAVVALDNGEEVHFGYNGIEAEPGQFASVAGPFENLQINLIPESEWAERIKYGRETGSFCSHRMKAAGIACKSQNGLPYCWIWGSTSTLEICRSIAGMPYVALSPASCGIQITGGRSRGGYASEAIKGLVQYGACEESYCNGSPYSLSAKGWKADWKANSLLYRASAEWVSVPDFATLMTCLLCGIPCAVGYNWWGHLVVNCDPWMFDDGTFGVLARNSWGSSYGDDGYFTLKRSKAQPNGAFALASAELFELAIAN